MINRINVQNIFFLSIVGVTVMLSACSSNNTQEMNTTEVQQISTDNHTAAAPASAPVIPAFTVRDSHGSIMNLQVFKGKKLFVNLWASWCPPCRREMPSIEKLLQSVDTSKVRFVLLSLDNSFDIAKSFIKKQKLHLPIYYPAENLPALFNVQGIPTTFIFNENGELIQRIDGGDDYNATEYRKLLQ